MLLARLAAAGSAGTPRDTLATLFWPETPPETSRHALSNLVYQARKALGRDAIEGHRESLRLRADRFDVDLWRFRQAIEVGNGEAAVHAYGGPFLDGIRSSGVAVERWVEAERHSLAAVHIEALEALANGAADLRQAGLAAHWWQKAVDQDPLHSARTCELMLWLARSGDPARAIQLAARHRTLREEQLGLGPEPTVDLLVERIRTGGESVLSSVPNERDLAALMGPMGRGVVSGTSVAVLPFRDLTEDGSLRHIAHGIAISLSHRLAGVDGVVVAASSSATTLAKDMTERSEIARKLMVRTLLEGTVRRVGDDVEITAQLVDGVSGYQNWSERITGTPDELLAIEDRIGLAVVDRFLDAPSSQEWEGATRSSHEEYLRGLLLESQLHWESTERAALAFERVVAGSPEFAMGRTALARAAVLTVIGVPTRRSATALDQALECANRALELAPDSGDAHAAYGWAALFGRWDLMGARRAIYRATSLGIRHPMALTWASMGLSLCGDPGAAAALGAEAARRDPFGYGTRLIRVW
ncbi:MAG: hypothetical protein OEO23_16840, partial [Gemmatimonadota bacterium]|nr:hypothetical protein [Gemmatimonadota bacterium]